MQFLRRMPGRPISMTAVTMPRPFQFGWLTAVGFMGVCVGGAAAVSISDQPSSPYARVATSYRHESAVGSDGTAVGGWSPSGVIFRGLDPWLGGASRHALDSRDSVVNDPHQVTSDGEAIGTSSSTSSSLSADDVRTQLASCDGVRLSVSSSVQGQRRNMEDDFDLAARGHFAAVFDGHGGREVARYAKLALYDQVCAHLELPGLGDEVGDRIEGEHPVETALRRSIAKLEADVKGMWRWRGVGSTLCAVCVVDADVSQHLGCGDSVVSAAGEPSVMMRRHHSGGGDGEFALGAGGRSTAEEGDEDAASASPPPRYAITANLGDSRAVLCRSGKAVDLTQDHKPDLPAEKQRVEALGGRVAWHGLWTDSFSNADSASLAADLLPTASSSSIRTSSGSSSGGRSSSGTMEKLQQRRVPLAGTGVWRVNGNLAVSRALGDAGAKPWVSGAPELRKVALDEAQDEFILVASDGLWDVMSSDEAVAFVRGALGSHTTSSSSSSNFSSAAAAAAAAANTPDTAADSYSNDAAVLASSSAESAPMSRLHGDRPLESSLSAAEVQQRKRQMARCLTEEAERLGTTDNITVLVLWLK